MVNWKELKLINSIYLLYTKITKPNTDPFKLDPIHQTSKFQGNQTNMKSDHFDR